MAMIGRDRIRDDGSALIGERSRMQSRLFAAFSAVWLIQGLLALSAAWWRALVSIALAVAWVPLAVAARRPARIDADGVQAPGRLRRIPWHDVRDIVRSAPHEASITLVLTNGRRVPTGFPPDHYERVLALAGRSTTAAP